MEIPNYSYISERKKVVRGWPFVPVYMDFVLCYVNKIGFKALGYWLYLWTLRTIQPFTKGDNPTVLVNYEKLIKTMDCKLSAIEEYENKLIKVGLIKKVNAKKLLAENLQSNTKHVNVNIDNNKYAYIFYRPDRNMPDELCHDCILGNECALYSEK